MPRSFLLVFCFLHARRQDASRTVAHITAVSQSAVKQKWCAMMEKYYHAAARNRRTQQVLKPQLNPKLNLKREKVKNSLFFKRG
jgi:hypothetical protein